MQHSLVVLATFALVCLTTGQLNPQTACGQQAQTCYTANKDNVRKKLDEVDYRGACKDARTLFSCLNGVQRADSCNELQTYKNLIINMTDGICQPGGEGTTVCADRLGPCLQYAFIIKNDFANNNATRACPALNQLNSCAEDILKQNSCNTNINNELNRARTALSEGIMLDGCDGPCAKAIANCSLKLAEDVSNQPLSQTNWTDFCVQSFGAVKCIGKLSNSSGSCMGSSDPKLVTTMMNSYTAYLKDYCTDTGSPSQCMVGLEVCKVDLTRLTAQSTVADECAATAKFLECTSMLACETELKSVVDSVRSQAENAETTQHCPTVGTCEDRIRGCNSVSAKLKTINNVTQTKEFCSLVESAISCFDFVRRDPICSNEQPIVTDFETVLGVEIAPYCGAAVNGTCDYRFKICATSEKILDTVDNTTKKADFCARSKQGISCFDGVRKDQRCSSERSQFSQFETKLRNLISPYCSGAAIFSPSFIIAVLSLSVTLKHLFNLVAV